jgi:hypothetical protein
MTDRAIEIPAVSLEAAPNPLTAQYVEIAQKTHTPAKTADAPKVDVGDAVFNAVLSLKPTEFGPAFKDAQTAAKAFMANPDKADALTKGTPAFEAAIKQSDADYISAISKYSPEYLQKRHDLVGTQQTSVQNMEVLTGVVKQISEDKQQEVQQLIALASDPNTSAALKASVRKEMDQFPGLGKSFDTALTSLKVTETAFQAMEKAAEPLVHAAAEQTATRYVYAHALELGGDKGKGYLMKEEGKSKMDDAYFEYLDKPKDPPPLLKA